MNLNPLDFELDYILYNAYMVLMEPIYIQHICLLKDRLMNPNSHNVDSDILGRYI